MARNVFARINHIPGYPWFDDGPRGLYKGVIKNIVAEYIKVLYTLTVGRQI